MASESLINALIKGYDPAQRERELNALTLQKQQMQAGQNVLSAYPEEREWAREERGHLRETWGAEREKESAKKQLLPIKVQLEKMKGMTDLRDQVSMVIENTPWDGYEEYVSFWSPVFKDAGLSKPPTKMEIVAEAKQNLSPQEQAGKTDEQIGKMWLEKNRDSRRQKHLEAKSLAETKPGDRDTFSKERYGRLYRQLNHEEKAVVDRDVEAKGAGKEDKGQTALGKTAYDLYGKPFHSLNPEQQAKVREEAKKEGGEKPTETIRTFETVTGIDPKKRGTQEYTSKYHEWQQDLKEDKTVLPADAISSLSTFKTLHGTLENVLSKADKLQDKFGPIFGRWEKLKVKFKDDPESATIQRELSSLIQLAYGLSGKQISEKEMKILKEALLPQLEEPYANFRASLDFAMDWMARSHNNLIAGYDQAGYRAKAFPPITNKPRRSASPSTERTMGAQSGRQAAFDKLKATGKWSDQQINAYLDKKGIK